MNDSKEIMHRFKISKIIASRLAPEYYLVQLEVQKGTAKGVWRVVNNHEYTIVTPHGFRSYGGHGHEKKVYTPIIEGNWLRQSDCRGFMSLADAKKQWVKLNDECNERNRRHEEVR